ncbi:carbonic anhydrase [Actinomyces sp. 2119]|uniref:beta-class carbonic anhydrase n=1 Tax=Actinomyces sp. 2119 TaxID=2321393 RepID=UPI000E6B762C|nr:carbonic anhydrase [Actinomyces sp. 2119]RJF41426.1 carbonic anhydrase [Actinomyces sp. 2119]
MSSQSPTNPDAAPSAPTAATALEAARHYAADFVPARGEHATLAVVACMDRRLDVMSLLGLQAGDAYVIRNAGGILTEDVRRSLAIAQHALGVQEILLIHHTDCGMSRLDDETFTDSLERETGQRPPWQPGGFTDAAQDVRQALAGLTADPHVPGGASARGFVYDVATGRLTEVQR